MSLRRSRREGSRHKTFKELKDTDFIYQINPFTLEIEGLKIKQMEGVKMADGKRNDDIKRKMAITVFRREKLLMATDLDKARTTDYIVNMDDSMTFVMIKIQGMGEQLVPVPIFATHQGAKKYKEGQ